MQVRLLRSADEFDRCANFAQEVYRRSPHWMLALLRGLPERPAIAYTLDKPSTKGAAP